MFGRPRFNPWLGAQIIFPFKFIVVVNFQSVCPVLFLFVTHGVHFCFLAESADLVLTFVSRGTVVKATLAPECPVLWGIGKPDPQ